MTELIVGTRGDYKANDVWNTVKALGNVTTEIKGESFVISGAHIHVLRVYNALTGRSQRHLSSPTLLLGCPRR